MDWRQFEQRQQANPIRQQAYTQQQEADYRAGEHPRSGDMGYKKTEIKTEQQGHMTAVKVDFDLDVKTLQLEADNSRSNIFYFTADVNNDTPIDMYFYLASRIQINRSSAAIESINPKIPQDCKRISLYSGKNQAVGKNECAIDFKKYTFTELSKAFNDNIPVLVILERKTKLMGLLEKVIYFLQIE